MTIIDLTENKSKMYKEINYHKLIDLLYKRDYEIEKLKKNNEDLRKQLQEENKYLKKRFEAISQELYCKDRKLEELGVPIECCDTDE